MVLANQDYLQMAGNSADRVVINNSFMGKPGEFSRSDVHAGICANDKYTYDDCEHTMGSRYHSNYAFKYHKSTVILCLFGYIN